MQPSIGRQVLRVLALLWSLLTTGFLLFVSVLILINPKFPLNLGIINTTGRAGLWATLLPGLVGLAGVALLLWRSPLGTRLLGVYSLFWVGILASGLPKVWNAERAFCTRTFCITTPWISRLMVLALVTPFLLVAIWTHRQVKPANGQRPPTNGSPTPAASATGVRPAGAGAGGRPTALSPAPR